MTVAAPPSQPGRNRLFAPASANTRKISERPWTCMEALRASGIIKSTAALLEFLERPSRRRPPTREKSQSDLGHVWRRSECQKLSSPQRRSWNFWNFLERTQALKRLPPRATSCTLGGRARLRQTTRGQNPVGEDMTKIHTFGDGGAAGEVRSVSKLLKTSRRSPSHCLTQPRPPAQGTIGSLTAVTSAALVHRLALLISWIHGRAPTTCLHVQRGNNCGEVVLEDAVRGYKFNH